MAVATGCRCLHVTLTAQADFAYIRGQHFLGKPHGIVHTKQLYFIPQQILFYLTKIMKVLILFFTIFYLEELSFVLVLL